MCQIVVPYSTEYDISYTSILRMATLVSSSLTSVNGLSVIIDYSTQNVPNLYQKISLFQILCVLEMRCHPVLFKVISLGAKKARNI